MGIPMHEAHCPDNPNSDNYIFEGPVSTSDLKKNSRKQTRPKADDHLEHIKQHSKFAKLALGYANRSIKANTDNLMRGTGTLEASVAHRIEKRLNTLRTLVEDLADGEIIAVDHAKNRMIVSVPIQIPLQEIGVGKEDL